MESLLPIMNATRISNATTMIILKLAQLILVISISVVVKVVLVVTVTVISIVFVAATDVVVKAAAVVWVVTAYGRTVKVMVSSR